jgi:hypothetical protein
MNLNSLKKLLLTIVATGLVGSSFAIERGSDPETVEPAVPVKRRAESSGGASPADAVSLPTETLFLLVNTVPVKAIVSSTPGSASGGAAAGAGRVAPEPAEERVTAAADSEPSDWLQLLCGLMVAGFIVQRRTSAAAE